MKIRWNNLFGRLPLRPEPALAGGSLFAAAVLTVGNSSPGTAALLLIAGCGAAFLLLVKRSAAAVTAGLLLVTSSVLIRETGFFAPHDCRRSLPERDVHATARLRITDPRLTGVPGIPPPGLIRAELQSCILHGETTAIPLTGTVFLSPPHGSPQQLHYGEEVSGTGTFERPAPGPVRRTPAGLIPFPSGADFAAYLAGRGADRIFRADRLETAGESPGILGHLIRVRDAILERALAGVKRDSTRRLAAALFFGATGGLDATTRREFIDAGAIHLFSVSGMHVAILAGVLLTGLRILPPRIRYPALLAILGGYVATTGANAPATRAFFMIAVWALLRMALFSTPAENVLCLAAAVLVILTPPLVADLGFQYSFTITLILILTARRFRELNALFSERFRFMPGGPATRRRERRQRRLLSVGFAAAGCIAAFLGGAGISLYSQGLLLPGSIVANLLLIPVISILFPLLGFKLVFGSLLSSADHLGAELLDFGFRLLEGVTRFAADTFDNLAALRPGVVGLLLFYAGLLALLTARSRRIAAAGGATTVLIMTAWIALVRFEPPVLLAGYGGRAELPFAVIAEPARNIAFLLNAPDRDSTRAIVDFLRRRGVTRLEEVSLPRYRNACIAGLPLLATLLPIGRISLPVPDRFGWRALDRLELELPDARYVPYAGGNRTIWHIIDQKNRFEIEYFNPGSMFNLRMSMDECDAGWRVTIHRPDNPELIRLLTYGNVLEIWEHEFR